MMISSRLRALLLVPATVFAAVFALASPAAAVTYEQKVAALSSFTQVGVGSYNTWNAARQNQGGWADYGFDWSTDYCSSSPDNPVGFDFKLSCYRHDFGYRNYKAVGQFSANKARLDNAFYDDLKRRCASYNVVVRPACYSLAWTYYQAVKAFGSVIISDAELARVQKMKSDALANAGMSE
jgi:hypothetical protein